jgi:hypothetical protein
MRYFVKYSCNNPSGWPVCDSNLPVNSDQLVCRAVSKGDAENISEALNAMESKITIDNKRFTARKTRPKLIINA